MQPMDPLLEQLRLLARYNQWMNARLYAAAATLPPAVQAQPLGAFFGSILGTLNHGLVADTIWLRRFATHPTAFGALDGLRTDTRVLRLDQTLHQTLEPLRQARDAMDRTILALSGQLTGADLAESIAYRNSRGLPFERPFGALLVHFFNHQTHHRGQVTTLLYQQGVDPGETDLLALIPSTAS